MLRARHVRLACLAAATSLVLACGGAPQGGARWPDAAIVLRDDGDRAQAIDALWVLPPGAARARARVPIAAAIARRIADAAGDDRQGEAAALLDQLTALWQDDPAEVGTGLAPHAALLARLRAMFARAGALEPTVQTLVLLAEVAPATRGEVLAELDEVLAFADDLAIADNGLHAGRAQPLVLLAPTALALPLPWLVDRYVGLLVERQRVVARLIETQGASMPVVRAHHDILSTSRRIASVLARAGRVAEIHGQLARLAGIGFDRALALRAEIVADQPAPAAFAELASALRADEGGADPAAALAVCRAGLARTPDDVPLLLAAAGDARALGRLEQPIALYEHALRRAPELDPSSALRLGRLHGERIARLATSGRPGAARAAWRAALAFTSGLAGTHPHMVWQQAAAVAESALGRGLASQGLLAEARATLRASIERAPSVDAYEMLTVLDLQTGQLAQAEQWGQRGLALLGEQASGDRYRRAKLGRLLGDVARTAGDAARARAHYLDAMRAWASLGDDKDLPQAALVAERHLDSGRILWWLGEQARGVGELLQAVDLAPAGPSIAASAVVFLLQAGRERDAIDAYYRGLGSDLDDGQKIYMSLWLAVDARRRAAPVDRLAADYLATRHGDTWPELLARAATHRLPYPALRAAATTGPRRAELAFYGALLGLAPEAATPAGVRALLGQVVAAQVVLDAEYELARRALE